MTLSLACAGEVCVYSKYLQWELDPNFPRCLVYDSFILIWDASQNAPLLTYVGKSRTHIHVRSIKFLISFKLKIDSWKGSPGQKTTLDSKAPLTVRLRANPSSLLDLCFPRSQWTWHHFLLLNEALLGEKHFCTILKGEPNFNIIIC